MKLSLPRQAPGSSVAVVVVGVVDVNVGVGHAAGAEIIFSKKHFQYNEGSPTTSIPKVLARNKSEAVSGKGRNPSRPRFAQKAEKDFSAAGGCRKKFNPANLGQDTFSDRLRRVQIRFTFTRRRGHSVACLTPARTMLKSAFLWLAIWAALADSKAAGPTIFEDGWSPVHASQVVELPRDFSKTNR